MSKWTKVVFTKEEKVEETPAQKKQRIAAFEKAIKNTKSLSAEDLKKESDMLYAKKVATEDSLLKAFEDKKLKSNNAIKQALRIKKEREKQNKNAKQSKETVSNEETTESVAV